MKRLATLVTGLAIAGSTPLMAQAHDSTMKHSMKMGMEDHAMSGWKELDAFHMVLMKTWHPAGMQKDLGPTRARAGELAALAEAWAKSPFPKACDTPVLRDAVARAASGARALAAMPLSSTDAELTAALKGVHDSFEGVEKGCKPGASHH